VQKLEVWQEFAAFMFQNQLITKATDAQKAFTNDFLP